MEISKASDREYKKPKDGEGYPYSSSSELFHTEQLFLFSEKVEAGKRSSAPHYHRSIDEIVFVTSGKLYAVEGEREILLEVGDSVCFKFNSKLKHYLENRSEEEATFLLFRRATKKQDVVY